MSASSLPPFLGIARYTYDKTTNNLNDNQTKSVQDFMTDLG
ncbi:hypothetical protein [Hoylesella marshii]|uniref:Uncharacterized protein n=1 Tax=Hoylesella marshii DSM 16973 = JCM 13450 TaxID=862515 RepID=E0NR25_9BACT|nr:hypothetical protein [Hoylesella marshii]EFM02545.1 hypothetical protein HMPREF0658_0626 [Hoylesella marshii DSM 16973 = JCM 13450]